MLVLAVVVGASALVVQRTAETRGESGSAEASDSAGDSDSRSASPTDLVRPALAAPRKPPARICGSPGLAGPSAPPAGARVVRTSANLKRAVLSAPRGATLWLEPGEHHLGDGEYEQVAPRRGQTITGAPGAVLDGRGLNRYAFSGEATDVTIAHLTIRNFVSPPNEGVVNHDGGDDWTVTHNTIVHNSGAGVLLADGTVATFNCLLRNGQYGFSAYEPDGVRDVVLRRNEIARNNTDDWERRQPGCGCTGGGKFWETTDARVIRNWVHDNRGVGLWADTNNTGFLFDRNYISGNDAEGIVYETSYNAAITNNTFEGNAWVSGPEDTGFPTPAVYISESGSDPRAGSTYSDTFDISGNRFIDNWSGVFVWENSDRFAGSPANSSTGYTTLVNPEVATVEACGDPDLIGTAPYIDDCRWKSQHVRVRDNLFVLRPDTIGSSCRRSAGCGFSGLVSNYGTSPDWSPYQGYVVPDNITLRQDNVWSGNRYVGPWHWMQRDLGNEVSWSTWRSPPAGQDAGSTRE